MGSVGPIPAKLFVHVDLEQAVEGIATSAAVCSTDGNRGFLGDVWAVVNSSLHSVGPKQLESPKMVRSSGSTTGSWRSHPDGEPVRIRFPRHVVIVVTTMMAEQGRIRVSGLGGTVLNLRWLGVVRIPPGVTVEVIDFGYRFTVIVTQGESEIAIVADLGTGDIAESTVSRVEEGLREFARFVAGARMSLDGPEEPSLGDPVSEFAQFIQALGARRISPYGAPERATPLATDL